MNATDRVSEVQSELQSNSLTAERIIQAVSSVLNTRHVTSLAEPPSDLTQLPLTM